MQINANASAVIFTSDVSCYKRTKGKAATSVVGDSAIRVGTGADITKNTTSTLLFDVNQLDLSVLYHSNEDKMKLQSLPELQRELILAERVENIKNVEETKKANALIAIHQKSKITYWMVFNHLLMIISTRI
jgi:hypothetical protein